METQNIPSENNFSVGTERESWKIMVQNLYQDMSQLIQRESQLIRSEVTEKISDVKTATGSLAVGGVLLFVGIFAAVATVITLLALVMDLWASCALVSCVLFVVGGIMVKAAQKKLTAEKLRPRQSIETIGEISNSFKERINEFKHH